MTRNGCVLFSGMIRSNCSATGTAKGAAVKQDHSRCDDISFASRSKPPILPTAIRKAMQQPNLPTSRLRVS